jgi:hypothetical protein
MKARWIPFLLIAATGLPVSLQAQSQNRFALTAPQVARALSDSGIQTTGEQVSLLTRVVATEPSPKLDILSVETLGKGPLAEHSVRARVKLACHLPRKCLPFYAIVSSPQTVAGSVAGSTTVASSASIFGNPRLNASSEITMKAGTHATLLMDDQRAHIQVAVISLENGMVGHRIRVATPDHKQTYIGEVLNARLLRGSF